MSIFLKVKIKTLAAEARIIRAAELRQKSKWRRDRETNEIERITRCHDLYDSLHSHRVVLVREEARSALLAYAILRRLSYSQVERTHKKPVSKVRVAEILLRFATVERQLPQRKDLMVAFVENWLAGHQGDNVL